MLSVLLAIVSMSFPGGTELPSPDATLAVVYRRPAPGAADHKLLLARPGSHDGTPFYSFETSTSVLWSPDSRHLAVTDLTGDESRVVVVESSSPATQALLDRAHVLEALGLSLVGAHHVRVEAVRWLSSTYLILSIRGQGGPNPAGFQQSVLYNTRSGAVTPWRGGA